MQKIISLFKRDYKGNRQVYDEVVPGAEWVLAGEGRPTIKYDGTCCMVRDGRLFKRYDRKLTKAANKRKRRGHKGPWEIQDFKPAPNGWEAAEAEANQYTGHWPGWVPVGDGPEDKWHREAQNCAFELMRFPGTYELLGPKIQGNPYKLGEHHLYPHGAPVGEGVPRDFAWMADWFIGRPKLEGIVWHHPDGRMVKIKRKDFGLPWPPPGAAT